MDHSKQKPFTTRKKFAGASNQVSGVPTADEFLGKLAETMKIVGDVTRPIQEPEAWDALR